MAIIKQYGGQKVQTQNIQSVKKSDSNPGAIGINVTQQIGNAAQVVRQKQLQMKADDMNNRVNESLIQYQQYELDALSNVDSGYLNTQGLDSYTQLELTQEQLRNKQKELSENLEGEARNAFDDWSNKRNLNTDKQLMDHAQRGLKAHKQSVSQAGIEVSIEGAAANWNQTEPEKDEQGNIVRGAPLLEQYNTGISHIIDMADSGGISLAEKNEKIQDYKAVFASAVVNGSYAGGSEAAKKSLEYVEGKGWLKDEPETLNKIKSDIVKLEATEEKQAKAKFTVAQVDEYMALDLTRAEANSRVKEIPGIEDDPELRADMAKQIKYSYDTQQLEQDELNKTSFEDVSKYLYDGTGSVVQFKREQPGVWDNLTTAQKKSFEAGEFNVTDFDFWYNDIGNLSDEQLSKLRPEDYYHKLAEKERNILDKRVNDARNKKPDAQVGQTRQTQVKETLQILTGKPSNKWTTPVMKKEVATLQQMIDNELEFREKQKGYTLTPSEFSDMLSELTTDYVLKDKIGPIDFDYTFNQDVDVNQDLLIKQQMLHLTGEPVGLDDLVEREDELDDTISQIKELLISNNVPEESITNDMIINLYKQGLQ